MSVKEALNKGSIALQDNKKARILLSFHLGLDALKLILHEEEILSDETAYFSLIKRAQNREPIEYITQKVSFYSEEFFIKEGALIPRPETEILLDKALQALEEIEKPKVAEIGVGSGILSVMIAKLKEDAIITATDISEEAIAIAKVNAEKFAVSDKITFVHTPYLADVHEQYDLIISNPPYIAHGFELEEHLSYEPDIALYGGQKGDEVLKGIIDLMHYQKKCILCCEMGYDQKESLERYMTQKGILAVTFYKDLSGFDRGFVANTGEHHQV